MRVIKLIAKTVKYTHAEHIAYAVALIQIVAAFKLLWFDSEVIAYGIAVAHGALWYAAGNHVKIKRKTD